MGEWSKIAWCHHTFNPWIGCTKVAPECKFCYAEAMAKRYGWAEWGDRNPRHRTSIANWHKPILWNRAADVLSIRHRVFCASLADVFDAEVDPQWRTDLFAVIQRTPALDWMLLTKRPNLIASMLPESWGDGWPNVWLGTSVGHRESLWRADELVKVPARIRFLSCEPLLESIDLKPWLPFLHLVIVGGESGSKARPFDMNAGRFLLKQTKAAGVAPFMKQLGARPFEHDCDEAECVDLWPKFKDPAGANPEEWPADLRIREMPKAA